MQIAQSRTRQEFPLSRKKITKKTVSSGIVWGILSVIAYFVLSVAVCSDAEGLKICGGNLLPVDSFGTLGILGLFILITSVNYFYQCWYFSVYYYDLTSDYIIIKKGPITPQEITIPYERVQDVYVDQDIWDRIFGIYDVHLSSATMSSAMEAHIDGVDKVAAEGLKLELLKTVNDRISRKKLAQNS